MSDDRMDRAERIRNMREGSRGTDDQSDDAETTADEGDQSSATDGDDTPASSSATREPDSDGATAGRTDEDDDTGVSSLTTDSGGAGSATGTGSETPSETAAAASQAAEAVESQTEAGAGSSVGTTSTTDAASDAQAAAQRAAQSAATVMGTGADAAGGADPDAGHSAGGTESDTPSVPSDATGAETVPGDITGVELPDQQLLEEAMATSSIESTEGGARAAMEGESTTSEEVVRVLEFALGGEYYCLDIEYVEEIVKRNTVTRVPNTPDFVDGVVDLRGQITTILEPKEMMDIEGEGQQNLIIVFDPEQFEDQGAIGWVVDEVRQVVPIPESDVNHPPVDAKYINGVVDRDEYEQFVIWVEPEDALAQATTPDEE